MRAGEQQRHLTSAMPFHGLTAPELRALLPPHLRTFATADRSEWERTLRAFWDGGTHREEWYATIALARHSVAREWQNLDDTSFWLRKAIRWALRQHARADPVWVRAYVDDLGGRLSGLSRREATKQL